MRLYFLKFLAFFLGCLACHLIQTQRGMSPALSAALVGFTGSFLHFPKIYDSKGLHSAIYAGAFAGMSSPEFFENYYHLILLSMIGAAIYLIVKPHLNGFGGRLGVISFVSSFIFLMLKSAW